MPIVQSEWMRDGAISSHVLLLLVKFFFSLYHARLDDMWLFDCLAYRIDNVCLTRSSPCTDLIQYCRQLTDFFLYFSVNVIEQYIVCACTAFFSPFHFDSSKILLSLYFWHWADRVHMFLSEICGPHARARDCTRMGMAALLFPT